MIHTTLLSSQPGDTTGQAETQDLLSVKCWTGIIFIYSLWLTHSRIIFSRTESQKSKRSEDRLCLCSPSKCEILNWPKLIQPFTSLTLTLTKLLRAFFSFFLSLNELNPSAGHWGRSTHPEKNNDEVDIWGSSHCNHQLYNQPMTLTVLFFIIL